LIALFIGVSLVELLGLGLIVPYMLLIVDPESVVDSKLGQLIMEYFSFLTGDKLIVLMSLGLVSIFLLKALLMIGINRVMIRFSFNLQTQLRCSLMLLYQSLRYTDYLQRNSSEYITALQQYTGTFTTGVLFNLLKMVSEMISLVAIIILLALTNGSMLAILIGLLGLIAYGYDQLFKNKISTYGKKLNDNQELMVQGIHEGIEGLKEIRILGKEDYFHSVVRRTSEKFAHYRGNVQLITIAPRYLLELMLVTFIVALVLSTFWTGEDLKSLIPTLSLFGFAAIRIIPATNTLINSLSQIRFNLDATSRLYKDLYNHQEDTLLTDGEAVDTTKFEVFEKLTFDKVCFRYPNASRNALDKVDFYIDKGECIGLVGTSGSGKTTLIDTMLGLLEPQNGDLNFNGKPLQDNINSWYKNVAYLPQEVFLIDNTLRCNVALGVWAEDIDNDRLKKALSQAQLTDLLTNYRTV
jgi:ATP-binding cassette, subfamily B, bacterial PglK